MQATKPQQLSPRGKASSSNNTGIMESGLATVSKSVAQRVMDVAGSIGSDTHSHGQISPLRLGSKNSIETEEEVDEITCDTKPPPPNSVTQNVTVSNNVTNKLKPELNEVMPSTLKGHKLSIIVPSSCSQQQDCPINNNNNNNATTTNTKVNTSSEYHQVEDDYYESRYDNAAVEAASANIKQEVEAQRQGSISSIPESPKAKSAPATPCNVTPTAFHQHRSHLKSALNPSPANTLPLDIRKNISTCRVLPRPIGGSYYNQHAISLQYLDELSRTGEASLKSRDYASAVRAFDQWIEMAHKNQDLAFLKKNFQIYVHRAEVNAKLEDYNKAIDDIIAARQLNPQFVGAYHLQGQYQMRIGKYTESLPLFAFGLAQDSSNKALFDSLLEAALSPLVEERFRAEFEPKYKTLQKLKLDQNKFVVVSVLGQCMLALGNAHYAVIFLESALKLGADNKKMKSSVLSSISYGYCLMKEYETAITYMQKELAIESELEDVVGQCRVLSNMGYTYYKLRKFDASLDSHRKQVNLALRSKIYQKASMGLNASGHVHVARNDFRNALTSHTRCLEILKQLGDNDFSQVKELLSIGHVHTMLNEFDAAEERYLETNRMIKDSIKLNLDEKRTGLIMVNFNLAYLYLRKQSLHNAVYYYNKVLDLSNEFISPDPRGALYGMRACNGLGQTYRLLKKFSEARVWFEKQLSLAEKIDDRDGQSQALCNLGMIHQHYKEYDLAWDCFQRNLRLSEREPHLEAYAHSYLASMHFIQGNFKDALNHYDISIKTFETLDNYTPERKTLDLNMAAVQERAGHLNIINPNMMQQAS